MQKSGKVAENIAAFVCVLTNDKSGWVVFVREDTNEDVGHKHKKRKRKMRFLF